MRIASTTEPFEVRYSAPAARRLRGAVAARGQIGYGVRRLAARSAQHAGRLRARTSHGSLAEPGALVDRDRIMFVRDHAGGFFLVRAGFAIVACDVFPERRAVLVLAIVGRHELAARLGLRTALTPYSLVQTVFSSR